jgi:hypothetical protein
MRAGYLLLCTPVWHNHNALFETQVMLLAARHTLRAKRHCATCKIDGQNCAWVGEPRAKDLLETADLTVQPSSRNDLHLRPYGNHTLRRKKDYSERKF